MHMFMTVYYTDKLAEVKNFWDTHFHIPSDSTVPNTYTIFPEPDGGIMYVDSATAGVPNTVNVTVRWLLPFTNLEQDRLISAGVSCSDLITANWGDRYGVGVRYFEFSDPSGLRIQIFEDRFGQPKQQMTTGDGTGTRAVHVPPAENQG